MENELVGRACDLLDAPAEAVGTITSGGTESVLLAVQAARDSRPEVAHPQMVLPTTAHAAFHKAAHYFGVEPVMVDVGPDFRARPEAMAAAITDSTVLVVVSALPRNEVGKVLRREVAKLIAARAPQWGIA